MSYMIRFRLTSGDEFTLSHKVYGGTSPLESASDASIQLQFILGPDTLFTPTDQGELVNPKNIASAKISLAGAGSRPHTREKQEPDHGGRGICECCGQSFHEATRARPKLGVKWTRALEPHIGEGVCPACRNLFGIVHGMEIDWSDRDWTDYYSRKIENSRSLAELDSIEIVTQARIPHIIELRARRQSAIEIEMAVTEIEQATSEEAICQVESRFVDRTDRALSEAAALRRAWLAAHSLRRFHDLVRTAITSLMLEELLDRLDGLDGSSSQVSPPIVGNNIQMLRSEIEERIVELRQSEAERIRVGTCVSCGTKLSRYVTERERPCGECIKRMSDWYEALRSAIGGT